MDQLSEAQRPHVVDDNQSEEHIARRALLVKGAAVAVGATSGVFVSPRLTRLNFTAHAAQLVSPLPE